MILVIGLTATLATLLGGALALRFADKLHLVLGFSAGAVIGVAFFDLLPEALDLAGQTYSTRQIVGLIAIGFLIFMVVDRLVSLHAHENCDNLSHRGSLGAGTLSFHSLLDGLAIGLAFQVSIAAGAVVTLAVLTHDFSDGLNTVNIVVKNGGSKSLAARWLAVDAIAPLVGVGLASLMRVGDATLGLLLALFGGFFLYLGSSDLIPESHRRQPSAWTTLLTLLGVAVLYGVVRAARI